MSKIKDRIKNLSPEKQALLIKKMKSRKIQYEPVQIIPKRKNQSSGSLSFAQQSMWIQEQLTTNKSVNNIPAAIKISGELNVAALEQSLNRLIQRHEILRTIFFTENGVPRQKINPFQWRQLARVDLQAQGEHARHEWIHSEVRRGFDLARGPLLRFSLLCLGPLEHILILTFHHIISDGWSTGVIIRELISFYQATCEKRPSPLPEPSIQYLDYAEWQRNWLDDAVRTTKIDYWKKQLQDVPALIEFPLDSPRPAQPTFEGAHLTFEIPPEIARQLNAFIRQENVTPYVALLSIFQTLLFRYSGQEKFCVGSPVANRNQPQTENLVGFFVNLIPLRADFSAGANFRQLVQAVRQVAIGAFENQDLPFEMLVDALDSVRHPGCHPVFQILFDVQNTPRDEIKIPGLQMQALEVESGTVKFDLVLSLVETANSFQGVLGYNQALFNQAAVLRIVRHYLNLLENLIAHPDQPVGTIPMLSAAEQLRILSDWSQVESRISSPTTPCIHQFFAEQAERTPDNPALIFAEQHQPYQLIRQMTYRELNSQANQFAHFLRTQPMAPEARIGVCLERSPELIVALLGILKAGGAYVPIDPAYPADRIEYILQDADIRTIITNQQFEEQFKRKALTCLQIDTLVDEISKFSTENPDVPVFAENLAYLIYTSGSTGAPKGVMARHSALTNHAAAMAQRFQLREADRMLQFISLSFDASAEEIYPPLICGAGLVLVPAPAAMSGNDLCNLIKQQAVSILHLPAAYWHNWVDHLSTHQTRLPSSLRTVLVGGEMPKIQALEKLAALTAQPLHFINAYGPTETTITSCCFELKINRGQPIAFDPLPIGRAIQQVSLYVLDQHFNPLPVGVPGELYIGGAGLARGYLNRPGSTAEKFIPDLFAKQAGRRLYKTGDRARWRADGNLEFIERRDFQVKIRGFRIEPSEIEAALVQHPQISQAVVVAREDIPGDKRLAAYLVCPPDTALNLAEIHAFLRERLPDYMVPATFTPLDALPLTTHGKIDRDALPQPDTHRLEPAKGFVAPRDPLETFLVNRWQEILKIEQIGIYDNFFELGGNSILGATFVNRLQDELGEYVYLIIIFDAPTVAQMAEYLRKDYPQGAAKILGEPDLNQAETLKNAAAAGEPERIDAGEIERFRKIIIRLPARNIKSADLAPKNPRAVFILSAPRSGSTLLRVMLGGNPKLFAPPELQLLNFNTLRDQAGAFASERDAFWLDGNIRALMEIKNCEAETAKNIVAGALRQDQSVKQFYRMMQVGLDGRLFVDKTPNYALDPAVLNRAEIDFQEAFFIHLVRHPYGVIPSFEKAKLHVFYPPFFNTEHNYTPAQLAELIWCVSHQNILEFLQRIPAQRQLRIRYEDLVKTPEHHLRQLCQALDVTFDPDMLEPQKDKKQRMTDGLHSLAKMLGDVRFHEHKGIDAAAGDRWKSNYKTNFLGEITREMVGAFGYEPADSTKSNAGGEFTAIQPVSRQGELALSFGQRRLWFLDQMDPGRPTYLIPVALRISGPLNLSALKKSLVEIIRRHEVLRTNFQSVEGKAVLVINREAKPDFQYLDLTALSLAEAEQQARMQVLEEACRPFNLATDSLIRLKLIQVAENSHLLLLTMHHIVSDGWSGIIFIREFAANYRAFLNGQAAQLPGLPVQYLDYAHWQNEWLQNERLQRELTFWTEQLAGAPQRLDLPTDKPRPAEITNNGASCQFRISTELTHSLKAISRQCAATDFMTLLAAFKVLLYRYSGQDDICVGTPIANRSRAETEGLIGFFVNTLVLRTHLDGQPGFIDFLQTVKQNIRNAFGHQNIPFEMIIDALQLERNVSHTPLFQVMFAFQNFPEQDFEIPELTIQPFLTENVTAKFELTLSMRETEGEFRGTLEYNTDTYSAETIQRMLQHFQELLKNITLNPATPISKLGLLTSTEQDQQLNRWLKKRTAFPAETSLHQQFEKQVRLTPERLAVVDETRQLTFRELNQRANRIAHYLGQAGLKAGQPVGLCLERSVDLMAGVLGILKAGGAYLPLDPAYPRDRIHFTLEDAHAALLLSRRNLLPDFNRPGIRLVDPDADEPEINRQPTENPAHQVPPAGLAYTIYTSGSTGQPKGVMISHRSAQNLIQALSQKIYARFSERPQRISLNAPLVFDASVQQWGMLTRGLTLYILPAEIRGDGKALLDFVEQHQIEVFDCVPTQLKLMIQAGLFDNDRWKPRAILPGGEAIDAGMWQRLNTASEIAFFNMYGPTECTVDATIASVNGAGEIPQIGQPIPNTRVFVLDSNLELLPPGVVGELFISGEGLARGYLGQSGLTAEKFIPNPFSLNPGERMYRTGDLVRFLPDGNIEYVGRADSQIKLRGFRIELGEIEAVLSRHPQIKAVVLLVSEDSTGNQRLVAYFIPTSQPAPTVSVLRDFLQKQLPDYMIPAAFLALDEFPLTANGKIDRKALPQPEYQRPDLTGELVLPRTAEEKQLAGIWQQILGLKQIGIHDNFFELGGDSILSIQIIARAKQAGLQISPRQLFRNPTIAGLAAVAGKEQAVFAEQGLVRGATALTPIQHHFFGQSLPQPNHWNQAILLRVERALEPTIIQQCLDKLIIQHDALRLRFQSAEPEIKQFHGDSSGAVVFTSFDLSELSGSARNEKVEALASRLQAGLDLAAGPLVQVAWFDFGAAEGGRLLFIAHHLVIDAVSWRILLEDFQLIYQQILRSEPVQLPLKTTSYQAWAAQLKDYARTDNLLREMNYWGDLPAGPANPFPVDMPGGRNLELLCQQFTLELTEEMTQALLQDVPPVYGTQIDDILLTALLKTFQTRSGCRELLIQFEGHGREDLFEKVDLSRTVGWFTAIYPVYLRLESSAAPGEAIKSIKEQLRLVPNRGLGFGALRYLSIDSTIREKLAVIPVPAVSYNYLGQVDSNVNQASLFSLATESAGPTHHPEGLREHLIDVTGRISAGRLLVSFASSRELFKFETMEKLGLLFKESLLEIIQHCTAVQSASYTPSDFPEAALDQQELDELIGELDENP